MGARLHGRTEVDPDVIAATSAATCSITSPT